MHDDWLQSVKAGDKIIVSNGMEESIRTVNKVTATQIVVGDSRYKRKTGSLITSYRWNRSCITEATERRIAEVTAAMNRRFLTGFRWADVSDEAVAQVAAIVRAARKNN